MWLLYALKFTYRVIIDRCIIDPGYGRIKIDVINVPKNTYLSEKM